MCGVIVIDWIILLIINIMMLIINVLSYWWVIYKSDYSIDLCLRLKMLLKIKVDGFSDFGVGEMINWLYKPVEIDLRIYMLKLKNL